MSFFSLPTSIIPSSHFNEANHLTNFIVGESARQRGLDRRVVVLSKKFLPGLNVDLPPRPRPLPLLVDVVDVALVLPAIHGLTLSEVLLMLLLAVV